ncbi:MAG TPA: amidohydrolase family protein, partial [Longimicrobiales bacterium]
MNADPPATRLVLADRVHALRGDVPAHADALLVRDGRVLAVGPADELVPASSGAALLDLRGCTITPGLTDAHIHLLEWAMSRRAVDLAACRSPEECAAAVGRALGGGGGEGGSGGGGATAPARGRPLSPSPGGRGGERVTPSAGWVRGRGWNPHHWGGAYPHRSALDAIAPGRPVVLQSHDMHALWVNGRALAQAGIDRHTPDPAGGHIVRDDSGEPTGVLLEMAAQLVARRMPPPTVEEAEAALLEGQAALHRLGITGVHAFPSIHLPSPDGFWLLQRLRARDRLRLRVLRHIPLERLDDAIALGLCSGFGDDWLRLGAVKLFLDGALGSRTAFMAEPYQGDPANRGVEAIPQEEFRAAVHRAAAAGIAA